jgi:hypothetical protein
VFQKNNHTFFYFVKMARLPVEVLQQVHKHLEKRDLLQCQATSCHWYSSATEILYRDIKIRNSVIAFLLMRTLENEPSLGTYVKKFHISSSNYDEVWDASDLLDVVITSCPYLSNISFQPENKASYWGRLMLAGYRGQLRYLHTLQSPEKIPETIKCYGYAALAFRNTLKSLELRDQIEIRENMEGSTLTLYTDMFNELSSKLQEFEKLETLILCRHSSKGLAGVDDIFDRCLKLKKLTALFILPPGDLPGFHHKYNISSIKQRPEIKEFRGHTSILEHGDSLMYLMHKFPRLEKLRIADDCYDILKSFYSNYDALYESNQITTAGIMVKFFDYLSRISSVVVCCHLMVWI